MLQPPSNWTDKTPLDLKALAIEAVQASKRSPEKWISVAWFNLMLVYGEDGWWEVRRHTRDNREPNGWGFYESDPSKIVDELRLDWYRELCDPARVSEAHDFIEGLNRKAEVSLLVRQIEEEDERRLRSTN